MSSSPQCHRPGDPIQKHPPERRKRKKDYVVLYSCCCCCCCCLHTIGSAIGAALGGNYSPAQDQPASAERKYPSSQALYWSSLLVVGVLFLLIGGVLTLLQTPGDYVTEALFNLGAIGLGSLIILGPLWLLAASVVTAIRIAARQDLPHRAEYWKSLGWITLGSVLGTAAGIAIMYALFVLLAR